MESMQDLNILSNPPVENSVYLLTDPSLHEDLQRMEMDIDDLSKNYPDVKFNKIDLSTLTEEELTRVSNITNSIPTLYVISSSDILIHKGTRTKEELTIIFESHFKKLN
jgi:hypothetical protein